MSTRTARRDLEGLAMAGIPVYSQPGRGGGWSLIGGSRTDLSGLTAAEARTLFLVAGPSAATPQVRTALRKLVQALPPAFRPEAEAAAGAVVLDPAGWDHGATAPRPSISMRCSRPSSTPCRCGWATGAATARSPSGSCTPWGSS